VTFNIDTKVLWIHSRNLRVVRKTGWQKRQSAYHYNRYGFVYWEKVVKLGEIGDLLDPLRQSDDGAEGTKDKLETI
jgi:hypothetical protein